MDPIQELGMFLDELGARRFVKKDKCSKSPFCIRGHIFLEILTGELLKLETKFWPRSLEFSTLSSDSPEIFTFAGNLFARILDVYENNVTSRNPPKSECLERSKSGRKAHRQNYFNALQSWLNGSTPEGQSALDVIRAVIIHNYALQHGITEITSESVAPMDLVFFHSYEKIRSTKNSCFKENTLDTVNVREEAPSFEDPLVLMENHFENAINTYHESANKIAEKELDLASSKRALIQLRAQMNATEETLQTMKRNQIWGVDFEAKTGIHISKVWEFLPHLFEKKPIVLELLEIYVATGDIPEEENQSWGTDFASETGIPFSKLLEFFPLLLKKTYVRNLLQEYASTGQIPDTPCESEHEDQDRNDQDKNTFETTHNVQNQSGMEGTMEKQIESMQLKENPENTDRIDEIGSTMGKVNSDHVLGQDNADNVNGERSKNYALGNLYGDALGGNEQDEEDVSINENYQDITLSINEHENSDFLALKALGNNSVSKPGIHSEIQEPKRFYPLKNYDIHPEDDTRHDSGISVDFESHMSPTPEELSYEKHKVKNILKQIKSREDFSTIPKKMAKYDSESLAKVAGF